VFEQSIIDSSIAITAGAGVPAAIVKVVPESPRRRSSRLVGLESAAEDRAEAHDEDGHRV
jgi:hypothetical protein